MEIGYLQHGQAGQPMRTESVCVRHTMPDIYHAMYEICYWQNTSKRQHVSE